MGIAVGWLQLFCLTVRAETTNLPEYFTRVWQTQDGLPNNAVTAIVQTRDGYLWLATYDGLARFDGVNFVIFDNSNTPEMRSSRMTSLFEDAAGNMWIGCESGELTRYQDGHFYAVPFHPPWESRKIQLIGGDASDKIWLLNPDGKLASLDGQTIAAPNTGGAVRVLAMAQAPDGTISVDSNGQVYTFDHGRMVPLPLGLSSSDYVKWICHSRDGSLWIITQDRLLKWNGNRTEDLGQSPLGESSVTTMLELNSGGLAVGTLENGLFLIFPQRGMVHFDRAHGFPNNWVRTLCEDREGTLWVGTGTGGLVAPRPSRVATLNAPDEWQGANVLSITSARNGAMWIGTEGAGLYGLQSGQWTHFGTVTVRPIRLSGRFQKTRKSAFGWAPGKAGCPSNKATVSNVCPVSPTLPVRCRPFCMDGTAVTWLGTDTGLLRHQAGTIIRYGAGDGLILPDVRAIAEAPDGTLWFGMMGGGLGRLQNGTVKQFRNQDGNLQPFCPVPAPGHQ